jgi:hypothetical protein
MAFLLSFGAEKPFTIEIISSYDMISKNYILQEGNACKKAQTK